MKNYENVRHGTETFPVGIHYTVCKKGFSLYPHIHREFEFFVMEEGYGTVYIEDEKFEIKQGEGLFINSEELHIGIKTNDNEARFFAVVFAPEIFGNFATDIIMQKYVEPVIKKRIQIQKRLDDKCVALLKRVHEADNELVIKALLFEIWDMCIRSAKKNSDVPKNKSIDDMKMMMNYIKDNYNRAVTLEEMAAFLNVSKGFLCRQFSKVLHMTPFEYLIRIRIDKGCEMLKNTDLPVGEIATRCGFNSFGYFSKIFRERVGISPREYRNSEKVMCFKDL